MKKTRFQEYVDAQKKIGVTTSKTGENLTPKKMPNTPPQGGKPYMPKEKAPKKNGKGFADMGDKKLKFEPKGQEYGNGIKGKSVSPAKIPTSEAVSKVVRLASMAKQDASIVETLVLQFKNAGLLGPLVAEACRHRDTFRHLNSILAHESYGPAASSKFVSAMMEEVAPPFAAQLDMGDEEGQDDVDPDDQFGMDGEDEGDDLDLGLDDESGMDDELDPTEDDEDMDLGAGDLAGADGMDQGMDDPNAMDPSMDQMDPGMEDPNAMDPSMDPSMMGQGMGPGMGQPPMMPGQPPAMSNLQQAMMRMMRKF